jgi:putative acetyltransferase
MHKDFQKQGIASQLLDELEAEAQNLKAKKVTSEISITAKSFFERRSFTTIQRQENERNGIILVNFKMEKQF